ncbi:MAG: hypothetical protein LBS55_06590 [Prevotellaceae bacterium]|jgi:hypothetical protein|nr:hypothetical protein [Prevotellaceae bacterium]
MLKKIDSLKHVRKEREKIKERERDLLIPSLEDLSLIPCLYGLFEEIGIEENRPDALFNVYERKKFFFIILFLYSPGTLLGDKMPPGLRSILGATLKLHSNSVVSNDCAGIMFLYERYSDFRKETDEAYREIAMRLEKNLGIRL